MNIFEKRYIELLELYGPQGWWPLLELHDKSGSNPTKSGSVRGYHPGDYSYPRNKKQIFEICVGAILTQNTNWPNVEKAMTNLQKYKLLSPEKIISSDENLVKEAIKPAGYYNQKCRKLIIFSEFFRKLTNKIPTRKELLSLWGIGPETADSILLYAYNTPTFVVDAYTRRALSEWKLIEKDSTYEEIKELFEKNLVRDYRVYQEYHALIVEYGKNQRLKWLMKKS